VQCVRCLRDRISSLDVELLESYIDKYSDYLALKVSDRAFFDAITEKITELEKDWNLLFLGFDDNLLTCL
jgi:hypothetical protein